MIGALMIIERDNFLTEQMGECWHEYNNIGFESYQCNKCLIYYNGEFPYTDTQNDFSTPEGFFKLWNWAQTQVWWESFLWNKLHGINAAYGTIFKYDLIQPDRFADTLYNFIVNDLPLIEKNKGL